MPGIEDRSSLQPQLGRAEPGGLEAHGPPVAAVETEAELEQYRRILESSHDCIKVLDLEGRILSISAGGQRVLEIRDMCALLQTSWFEFWDGSDRTAARAAIASACRGDAGRFEGYSPTMGGTPKWWDVLVTPMLDAEGRPDKLLAVSRDITERCRAEQALARAHGELEVRVAERTAALRDANAALERERVFLSAVLDNIEDGIVACDGNGVLTLFNRATRSFHDLAEKPLPPEQWAEHYDLYQPDGRTRMRRDEVPLFRALRGEEVRDLEMVIASKRRPPRTLLASGRALRGERGEVLGAVVSMHDITDRQLLEEHRARIAEAEARRAVAEAESKARDEMLAMVSHDLRTPLGAALGWMDLLETARTDEQRTRAVEAIKRNLRLQTRLVEDLLTVSSLTAGKLTLTRSATPVAELALEVLESVAPVAAARNVALVPDIGRGVTIMADPDRLRQVLWNVLANAVKFTPPDGRVLLRLEVVPESAVRIVVSDTGIGIEADLLPHVFQRFRQGAAGHREGGAGLGLTIAKAIVEMHGGTIAVASGGRRRGTTVTVQIPITLATPD